LITFDDGLANNFTEAFPVLRRLSIPATVFLTLDYIGTKKILWVDELLFLIRKGVAQHYDFTALDLATLSSTPLDPHRIYFELVEKLKLLPHHRMIDVINVLRSAISYHDNELPQDFLFLTWEQIKRMKSSGLIDFGVHTANHRILSRLPETEWRREIAAPRHELSERLREDVVAFSYPNGRPFVDFAPEHQRFLNDSGYRMAFTTQATLIARGEDPFCLGRIPAGHDLTSDESFFRLNTSGLLASLKATLRFRRLSPLPLSSECIVSNEP
jgi:peptidoglycan/xylan/chitin deacetylase (PgdA/CDA1 family)